MLGGRPKLKMAHHQSIGRGLKSFFKQFLPKEFKSHVMNAWDNLHMEAQESVDDYSQRFSDYYLQVLPFKKISRKTQMEKYKAGLTPKIQTQVNTQYIKGIQNLNAYCYSGQLDAHARPLDIDVTVNRNATKKEA